MARPAEKARSMLNKWVKMREEGNQIAPVRGRRPRLATQCNHLADAEYYRNQIVREITADISKIQNPALGEHTLRDLNDEINRKMREKHHWNKRIKELGGLDFIKMERERQIEEGDLQTSLEGPGGYRYFGAAKELPGVKELFEQAAAKKRARKKGEIVKHLTPSYYGWRDEEDGVLLELEEESYQKHKKQKMEEDDDGDDEAVGDYLNAPSQEEVTAMLLAEKKKALLSKLIF
mmetsp:Transcript_45753/g.110900  ORF Transcript_45753/g.110900 Transcript_45753/m.110900 type:complete len:234 (+) Transcript_45753:106-807(+)